MGKIRHVQQDRKTLTFLQNVEAGPGVNGRHSHRREDNIKMDLQDWDPGAWTESIWLSMGQVAGNCECTGETIKSREFLE